MKLTKEIIDEVKKVFAEWDSKTLRDTGEFPEYLDSLLKPDTKKLYVEIEYNKLKNMDKVTVKDIRKKLTECEYFTKDVEVSVKEITPEQSLNLSSNDFVMKEIKNKEVASKDYYIDKNGNFIKINMPDLWEGVNRPFFRKLSPSQVQGVDEERLLREFLEYFETNGYHNYDNAITNFLNSRKNSKEKNHE